MDELELKIRGLMASGFNCSQIMFLLSHEMRGLSNPELIRAMGGLGGGMFTGDNCGSLTGGCALLASFGAKGSHIEGEKLPYKAMAIKFVGWFKKEFGSADCRDILSSAKEDSVFFCPVLMAKTFEKAMEILVENGVDPNE